MYASKKDGAGKKGDDEVIELVLDMKKDLQKALNPDVNDINKAVQIITQLSKINMSLNIFEKTEIGITVGRLRKREEEALSSLAKNVVAQWRKVVEAPPSNPTPEKSKEKSENGKKDKKDEKTSTPSKSNKKLTSSSEGRSPPRSSSSSSKSSASPRSPSSSSGRSSLTSSTSGDARERTAQLFEEALRLPPTVPVEEHYLPARELAQEIEQKLCEVNKGVTKEYKAKMRTLLFNLKDERNVSLRISLLSQKITPNRFVHMTSNELAADEVKNELKKLEETVKKNAIRGVDQEATTDQFKCFKCGERKCTYRTMQTRSADEPETVFVTCVNCGNRWKFS